MHSMERRYSGFVTPVYTAGELGPPAELLRAGGLVVFPTETVYGLGASALCDHAVARIFEAKGRPQDNPLILHLASLQQLESAVSYLSPAAAMLMEGFTPGPLTVVLPKSAEISERVTAGLPTVGVRIPSHPVALEFLSLCGVPVAAPSANISGRPSPTSLEMALSGLDGRVEAAVDGGFCEHGVESTIVRCTDEHEVVVLRPGAVTVEMITQLLARKLPGVVVKGPQGADGFGSEPGQQQPRGFRPEAPGMSYKHYQPRADVFVTEGADGGALRKRFRGKRFGVLAFMRPPSGIGPMTPVYVMSSPEEYAHLLYRKLLWFDGQGCTVIVAELPPPLGIGNAVRDRLLRAAAGRRV